MTLVELKYLLDKYRIVPDEHRGQHFLLSDETLDDIVRAAGLDTGDAVVEVGPGIGNLTAKLSGACRRVVGVEVDRSFRPLLDAFTAINTNVLVLYKDVLSVPFEELREALDLRAGGQYAIVANVPYYLTSRLISLILEYSPLPKRIVFVVQKEVAERIVAGAGQHSKLSLSVQFYGSPRVVRVVGREFFYPQPDVDSALLVIGDVHAWQYPQEERLVWQLISFGFSAKRKKLLNNLAAGLQKPKETVKEFLEGAHIEQNARAQDLSVDEWLSLTNVIAREKA